MNILIVEDEILYADQLEMMIDKLGHTHIGTMKSASQVLQVIKSTVPDLILMDINISGDHDGVELSEMINSDYSIPTIFITSLKDDMTFNRASRTSPAQFILKPFDELQLQRSIELALKNVNSKNSKALLSEDRFEGDHFFVKHVNQLIKVNVSDILYFEADGRYSTIHLLDKRYLLRMSLSQLKSRLPKDSFIQTHRSFLVNLAKITSIKTNESIVCLDSKEVPLSLRAKPDVLMALDYLQE